MTKNFDQVKEKLQAKLKDYLSKKGIDVIQKNIICLNPNHKDTNPSMSFYKDNKLFCHSCNCVLDIFMAAHYLDGKPTSGPAWFTDNFLWLAEKFEIPVEMDPLSEDELYKLSVFRAYADVCNLITIFPYGKEVQKEIKARGWTEPFCRKHNIGSVISQEAFKGALLEIYDKEFLQEIDLLDKDGNPKDIFKPTNLIFVVKDEHGRPVGFAARDLLWTKESTEPKYINSKTTGLRLNLYEKDRRLYGLDYYLKTRKGNDEPLYIFEGYPDWASAVHAGLPNCAAIGGTSFNDKHIRELLRLDVPNIIITLDSDPAGQGKVQSLLDKYFADVREINVSLIILPDGYDPDEYIQLHGLGEFLKLQKHDAFHWRMMQYDDRSDVVEMCSKLIPFIVSEPSYLKQEVMMTDLAKYTGMARKAVEKEVERLRQIRDSKLETQKKGLIDNLIRQLHKDPESAEVVLITGLNDLKNLHAETSENLFSADAYLSQLDIQKQIEESTTKQLGFKLGVLNDFSTALAGDWEKDIVLVFGGKSNHGKSAMLSQIALELAEYNPDVIILFLTIDDTAGIFSNRFVTHLAYRAAYGTGIDITLNKVKNPSYFVKEVNHAGENTKLPEVRDKAYNELRKLIQGNRLIVKDQTAGQTLSFAEAFVGYYREKFPEKKIVFFLDNFHKLQDFKHMEDQQPTRIRMMMGMLKNEIAVKYHIPVLSTMEYKKLGAKVRPSNDNLAESRALEYDANGIFHIYNELADYQSCGEELGCPLYWDRGEGRRGPVVEIIFGKNKISDFKGVLYYQFMPDQSRFEPVRPEIINEWRAQIKSNLPPVSQTKKGYTYVSRREEPEILKEI